MTNQQNPRTPEKLGNNKGGYNGVRVNIDDVLNGIVRCSDQHGWKCVNLSNQSDLPLWTLRRESQDAVANIYISAGIHGDEPAPVLAVLRLLEFNEWPGPFNYWICPCLNVSGFRNGTRENLQGIDLNRDYRYPESWEVRAHTDWLGSQPDFDVCFCLHEDWESNGFYLYELNPESSASLATPITQAASVICPIDLTEEIDGRKAERGVIKPTADPLLRPDWPEAFYLLMKKTKVSYTLESPSDFSMDTRVEAMAQALNAGLESYSQIRGRA